MFSSRILQLLVLHEDLWSVFTLRKVRGWDLLSFFVSIPSFPSPSADEAAFSPTYVSIACLKSDGCCKMACFLILYRIPPIRLSVFVMETYVFITRALGCHWGSDTVICIAPFPWIALAIQDLLRPREIWFLPYFYKERHCDLYGNFIDSVDHFQYCSHFLNSNSNRQ